jgi:hypothetical protein
MVQVLLVVGRLCVTQVITIGLKDVGCVGDLVRSHARTVPCTLFHTG